MLEEEVTEEVYRALCQSKDELWSAILDHISLELPRLRGVGFDYQDLVASTHRTLWAVRESRFDIEIEDEDEDEE